MPISPDFSCALCLQIRTAKVDCTMHTSVDSGCSIMCADCEGTSLCLCCYNSNMQNIKIFNTKDFNLLFQKLKN